MRIIRCDRCGKDISDYDNTGYVSVNWRPVCGDDGLVVDNPFEDRDFCEDCMDEIKAFVDKKSRKWSRKNRKQRQKRMWALSPLRRILRRKNTRVSTCGSSGSW